MQLAAGAGMAKAIARYISSWLTNSHMHALLNCMRGLALELYICSRYYMQQAGIAIVLYYKYIQADCPKRIAFNLDQLAPREPAATAAANSRSVSYLDRV